MKIVEYNIDKDDSKKAEMKRFAGSSMIPVIDVEGYVIRGYSPEEIRHAVEMRMKSGD